MAVAPDSEWALLARKKRLTASDVFRLVRYKGQQLREGMDNGEFAVSRTGIRASPQSMSPDVFRLLSSEEQAVLLDLEESVKLDFTCTPMELVAWYERNRECSPIIDEQGAVTAATEDILELREEFIRAIEPQSDDNRDPASAALSPELACFRDMRGLAPTEVTIKLLASELLEISARRTIKRTTIGALGLIDRRRGGLNTQGHVLLLMATGKQIASDRLVKVVSRLRQALTNNLGLINDPFGPKDKGWPPCFTLIDARSAADERAKKEAERRTVSLDQLAEQGHELSDDSHAEYPFEAENDDADDFLKQHKN